MNPYICVTYAQSDRQETDLFCRGLTRYGFRFSCINELGDPARRAELVEGASLLIALTSLPPPRPRPSHRISDGLWSRGSR